MKRQLGANTEQNRKKERGEMAKDKKTIDEALTSRKLLSHIAKEGLSDTHSYAILHNAVTDKLQQVCRRKCEVKYNEIRTGKSVHLNLKGIAIAFHVFGDRRGPIQDVSAVNAYDCGELNLFMTSVRA